MPRREALERRGDSCAMGSGCDSHGLARRHPDGQCRYLEAAVNGVLIASIYAPNGNPQPGPKFDYRLAWLKRLNAHAAELYATGAPVVLAGDYNIVPTDLDIYSTKSCYHNALLQPESRAAYQRLLAQGWTDAIRALHPKERMYTFWDDMRNRWERDGGLRLDHILLSSTLTERLQSAGVDRQTRGMADATRTSGPAPSSSAGIAWALPLLADREPTWGSASTFMRDWGLNQLADRLGEMA